MEQDVTNQTGPADSGATLPDPLAEALRLVTLASARGLHVRLMGGLAFHEQCREWTAVARGHAIGHKKIDRFDSVTATRVRLNILSSAAEPHIREFQLFGSAESNH